jgi:hypothetical protein
MRLHYKFTLFLLLAALTGCYTSVTHKLATNSGTGIRYYRSSPYLLVYSNSKGGLCWQILYLPDQTKEMMVTPSVVGGRSELDLYFHNGILTGSSELSDTTELPKAIISAVQSALPLIAKAAAFAAAPPQVPAPYLFKIVVAGDQVKFIGGQGDTPITVPLPPQI